MTYKEKLKAFEEGKLSEAEQKEMEADIDRFEALLDYFDSAKPPVALNPEDDNAFVKDLNQAVNRRVNGMVLRTVGWIILFMFLFVFGLSTNFLADKIGGGDLTACILQGIYSLVYIPTVVYMLYRSFVKKEKLPAIILIVWNTLPVILTFVISGLIGDAFAVFLPMYYGFANLPMALTALLGGGNAEGLGVFFAGVGMAMSVILSAAALILTNKTFQPIQMKKGVAVFLGFAVVFGTLFGLGTAKEVKMGYFPDSEICNEVMAKQIQEATDKVFTTNLLDKSIADADKLFEECGLTKSEYTENGCNYAIYTKNSDNIMRIEIPQNDKTIQTVSYYSGYHCINPYYSIEKLKSIEADFKGKSERETVGTLFNAGMYPTGVSYYIENGVRLSDYHYFIDIPATEYHLRYTAYITLYFENGVLISCVTE